MARSGHGLRKVSPGPAMPYPFMAYGQYNPETALWPIQGWPICRVACGLRPAACGVWPSSTPLDTPRRTPMLMFTFTFLFAADAGGLHTVEILFDVGLASDKAATRSQFSKALDKEEDEGGEKSGGDLL
jgi:hypothetical protein